MYATSGHSPQASREYDKPMRIWERGEGEGSMHREGEGSVHREGEGSVHREGEGSVHREGEGSVHREGGREGGRGRNTKTVIYR